MSSHQEMESCHNVGDNTESRDDNEPKLAVAKSTLPLCFRALVAEQCWTAGRLSHSRQSRQSRSRRRAVVSIAVNNDNILPLDHAPERGNRLRRASKTKLPSLMRFASTVSLVTWMCLTWPVAGADNPLVVEIWPGRVPHEIGNIGAERFRMSPKLDRTQVEVTEPTRMVTDVTKPTVTIYRPEKEKDTRTTMLIFPGGGYWNLYWQLEGEEVASWLNSIGVTGIILKYRVPRRPDEPPEEPARRPLQDAQRALSLVRHKARDRKSTRLNSSHCLVSRMPSSA